MKPLVIANLKMNFSLKQIVSYCEKFTAAKLIDSLIIAAPSPYLTYLAQHFPSINFSSQDVSIYSTDGPYTGEFSSSMLKSCFINYSIIGHSERRIKFNEQDEDVKAKAVNSIEAGIVPIICIGESAAVRKQGKYHQYLIDQLNNSVPSTSSPIIIAYEPIWAIGTNNVPTNIELNEAFNILKKHIEQCFIANNIRLIYGGSVNLDNVQNIINHEYISGVLVGGASLDYRNIIEML